MCVCLFIYSFCWFHRRAWNLYLTRRSLQGIWWGTISHKFYFSNCWYCVKKQTNKKTRPAIPWLWTLFETLRKPWDCKLRQRPLCAFLLFLQPRAAADTVHTCQPAGRRVSRWVGLAPVLTGGRKTRKKKNSFHNSGLISTVWVGGSIFFFFRSVSHLTFDLIRGCVIEPTRLFHHFERAEAIPSTCRFSVADTADCDRAAVQ